MGRFNTDCASRLVALGLLLLAGTASAQTEVPSAAAAGPSSSAPPSPPDVARASLELSSLFELQRLQLRENELLQIRQESLIAWPAVGLGVGIPLSIIMLPVGSMLLATSGPDYDDGSEYYDDNRNPARRAGGIVLALGVVALITTVCSGVLVGRIRRTRRAAAQELHSIRITRTHILRAFAPPDLPSGHDT